MYKRICFLFIRNLTISLSCLSVTFIYGNTYPQESLDVNMQILVPIAFWIGLIFLAQTVFLYIKGSETLKDPRFLKEKDDPRYWGWRWLLHDYKWGRKVLGGQWHNHRNDADYFYSLWFPTLPENKSEKACFSYYYVIENHSSNTPVCTDKGDPRLYGWRSWSKGFKTARYIMDSCWSFRLKPIRKIGSRTLLKKEWYPVLMYTPSDEVPENAFVCHNYVLTK